MPVRAIASVTADGELLHITTIAGERHTITHRLHALEARLDPRRFIRLGRGTLVNVDLIARVSPMPGRHRRPSHSPRVRNWQSAASSTGCCARRCSNSSRSPLDDIGA